MTGKVAFRIVKQEDLFRPLREAGYFRDPAASWARSKGVKMSSVKYMEHSFSL